MRVSRGQALATLRAQQRSGRAILGAGAGTGLSAKCAEAGGADFIVVYNSGRFRMAGRGSAAGLLPYGDANAIVIEMAAETLPVVARTPVLAGVCATDPFRHIPRFLEELGRLGFSGVQNFPTVGLYEGALRQTLEETGMGFDMEVQMIASARQLDLLTAAYVFDPEQAAAMAAAGADIVVPHVGTTSKGATGARTVPTMTEAVARVQAMHDAATAVNPEVLVLCHGGPIAEPEDAREVLTRVPGVAGFLGASSTERIPAEAAMTETVQRFKALRSAPLVVEAASPSFADRKGVPHGPV